MAEYSIVCPGCSYELNVLPISVGRSVRCPQCSLIFSAMPQDESAGGGPLVAESAGVQGSTGSTSLDSGNWGEYANFGLAAVQDHQLYQQLHTTRFDLNDKELMTAIAGYGSVREVMNTINRLAFKASVSKRQGQQLVDLIRDLMLQLRSLDRIRFRNEMTIRQIYKVCSFGLRLFKKNSQAPAMPDYQFCWLDEEFLDDCDDAIRELLKCGVSAPLDLTANAQTLTMDPLQQILVCYGLGMSNTMPFQVFADLPGVWKDFILRCEDMRQDIELIELWRELDPANKLADLIKPLQSMVDRSDKDHRVQFEGLLSMKSEITELRNLVRAMKPRSN